MFYTRYWPPWIKNGLHFSPPAFCEFSINLASLNYWISWFPSEVGIFTKIFGTKFRITQSSMLSHPASCHFVYKRLSFHCFTLIHLLNAKLPICLFYTCYIPPCWILEKMNMVHILKYFTIWVSRVFLKSALIFLTP